jgi:hypothetical protein
VISPSPSFIWRSRPIPAFPSPAADLTGAEIKDQLFGKTVYIETLAGSFTGTPGQGVIYYAPDGTWL